MGLKVNGHKSQLIFLGDVDNRGAAIEKILGCTRGEFPILYLSIPIRPGRLRKEDWLGLLEKFQKRLKGWQGKLLSLGGRLILNAVLSVTPLYHVFFSYPCMGKNKIDRIRKKFPWSGLGI